MLAVCSATALAAVPGSAAPPTISGLRAQVAQIQAQVEEIDHQVEAAAEAYNGAVYRHEQIQQRIAQNRRALAKARRQLVAARENLAARLRAAYVHPPPSRLQLVLQSRSISAAIAGADALSRASRQDAQMVTSIKALRDQAVATGKALAKDEVAANDEVATRARQRDQVSSLLRQRQAVLSSAQGKLGQALAAERERQRRIAEAQRRRAATFQAQTRTGGGSTTGGSGGGTPTPGGGAVVSGSGSAANAQAARIALQYLGVPYVWGGASPSGFDCSGLASYAFAKVGKSVPHYTGAIWAKFPRVTGPLQPGDLVFFRGLGHMGIYIGGGNFVHAPHTGDVVRVAPMSSRSGSYVGAVRP